MIVMRRPSSHHCCRRSLFGNANGVFLGSFGPFTAECTSVSSNSHASLDIHSSCLISERYQNLLRIVVWLFFLVAYSQAGKYSFWIRARRQFDIISVRQPVERLSDPTYATNLDAWEILLYALGLSIVFEGDVVLS